MAIVSPECIWIVCQCTYSSLQDLLATQVPMNMPSINNCMSINIMPKYINTQGKMTIVSRDCIYIIS